ncbi:MAG TPA: GntR family transcriptional regulator [Rhodobacteraceae bacterium]|nr:GntR family transcriptional regulator [Paracoccaceae bacterium]
MSVQDILDPRHWLTDRGGPRYVQLQRVLEQAIERGDLVPGTPLPSEREIADMTTLSRVTVRKAIQPLVEAGLVIQRRGSGTIIASRVPKVEQSLSILTSFTEDMARRGLDATSTWLERGMFLPSPEEMVALGLSAGDQVVRITRLRRAGDDPMAIERASLPPDILPDPQIVESSLYEVLARKGNKPVRALQRISAVNLSTEDATLLGVAPGAAGLHIERTSYLPGGRVVEFTRSVYRGDAYDFVAELRISEEKNSK